MNRKFTTKLIASVICVLMLVSMIPMSAFATIANWEENNVVFDGTSFGTNGYYNVISKKDYTLVPGAAVESEIVLNNATGTRRQVLHIIEVDPSNPDVSIVPGYYQIDKDLENPDNWSHALLTDMAKYYEDNLGYNIVGGMNTDLYYNSYSPRVLVYNGKWIGNAGENVATGGAVLGNTSSILYVFKDAEGNISCDVKAFNKTQLDAYLEEGVLLHAVGVSFGMVVKDGQLVNTTEKRGNDDAARSMVGVKEDGTLVICMNDGRGANNSVGFSSYEEGEAMLALGCQWAANCDGGGSSTFLTKRVGEETFTMRSVPCDGAPRATAHGIFVASNVGPTGELDVVNVESDYDIFAPKTEYTFGAKAIDTNGYAMDMPTDAAWALSDDSFGTIEGGKFVSNGTKGNVDIQVVSGGKVVGSKTITVADPAVFKLSATSTVIPYSTADKIRTITLPIVAMTGEANVYVDTNAVSVDLSNKAAGILDGFKFTATDDTSIAGVNVTVTYGETSLVYAIEFGKGSEIIWGFEDGDKAGFAGFEEAKKWSQDNGVNNTLVGSNPLAGQFNEYLSSETFIATTENGGEVRNGNKALAWRLDNTDASFASWSYNVLFNVGETVVLRDVANDMMATALGMWVYIPEGAAGLAFQSQFYVKNADGSYSCKQDHFMFETVSGVRKNLNSATEADIPESRWVYASIDISKYDYLCTPVATDAGNSRSPSFIRTYVKPTTPAELTFYIDDITLDYSSAVDDRVLPTITTPTYSTADTAVSLDNGAIINGNNVAFSATVADNAALDLTSGKITVDGVEYASAVVGNALSTKADIYLVSGMHTVAFETKDELGNSAKLTRTFTVAGDAVVELSGHNDSGETPKAQSVYYVDINVADLANVNKLTVVLKLNNANKWETEGAVVANGFKATYAYNEVSELLTVTVEATKGAKAETGVIVSIPVRVWTFDRYNYVNNTYYAPADMGNKPVVNVVCDVVYGSVELSDKTVSPIGGAIDVETELKSIESPYHIHDAELTVLNKEATATEYGYENRTYCETCKSVVDWGTILEPAGHNYEVVNGKLVCSDADCGHVFDGTDFVEVNGAIYYTIIGNLLTGWQQIEADWYYFDTTTYKAAVGLYEEFYAGVDYDFDEAGKLKSGAWRILPDGKMYFFGPTHYTTEWAVIDGETYYFTERYCLTGNQIISGAANTPYRPYAFDEDGKLINKPIPDGIFETASGVKYCVENGALVKGFREIDGKYYYFSQNTLAMKTGVYTVLAKDSNGILTKDTTVYLDEIYGYAKDANGNIITTFSNGFVTENGNTYYKYEGEFLKGFHEIDGKFYYFSNSTGVMRTGYYPVNAEYSNGLLTEQRYFTFHSVYGYAIDKNGDAITSLEHGFVVKDGSTYYYDNGEVLKGFHEIDGKYYYFSNSSGAMRTGYYPVNVEYSNGLLAERKYFTFHSVYGYAVDEFGNALTTLENGFVTRDGNTYYIKDGATLKGFHEIDDKYYYFSTSTGVMRTGYYPVNAEKSNGLLTEQRYFTFDAVHGYAIDEFGNALTTLESGFITRDGNTYYLKNGVTLKGFHEIDGKYYYFSNSTGVMRTGYYPVNAEKSNGLLTEQKYFTFDAVYGYAVDANGDPITSLD